MKQIMVNHPVLRRVYTLNEAAKIAKITPATFLLRMQHPAWTLSQIFGYAPPPVDKNGKPPIMVKHPRTGIYHTVAEISDITGLTINQIRSRYQHGWTPAELYLMAPRINTTDVLPKKVEEDKAHADFDSKRFYEDRAKRIAKKYGYKI